MPQHLVAGYLPDNFDPAQTDETGARAIHALNKEMIAAGVRKFAYGLGAAKSLRSQPDGGVLITDGPYLETKEHIGGFWNLECADMEEAVAWARTGVAATRGLPIPAAVGDPASQSSWTSASTGMDRISAGVVWRGRASDVHL